MKVVKKIMLDGHAMDLVCEDEDVIKNKIDGRSHTLHCLNNVEANLCAASFKEICSSLKGVGIKSVLEVFGGSGWHGLFVQNILNPDLHLLSDISPYCVDSISKSLSNVVAVRKDSFVLVKKLKKRKNRRFDMVHADFNSYTFNKYLNLKGYKDFVTNLFALSDDVVTITDSTIFGLVRFKKNFKVYNEFFGIKMKNYLDYYEATANYYYLKYGFGLRKVIFWNCNSSIMLFRKNMIVDYDVKKRTKKLDVTLIGE